MRRYTCIKAGGRFIFCAFRPDDREQMNNNTVEKKNVCSKND